MCPGLLLLLLLLLPALNSEFTASLPEDNTGREFIVAFPESIAFYYPNPSQNTVQITALYDDTQVNITYTNNYNNNYMPIQKSTLKAGETTEVIVNATLELSQSPPSSPVLKTLKITSAKNITVSVVYRKKSILQTALVVPMDQLGTQYLVPPIPKVNGTSYPADMVTTDVTERNPFKLIFVNGDKDNIVTVNGAKGQKFVVQPYRVAQMWVTEDDKLTYVNANQPIAVLFGHTCAIREKCTCGMLYTMLPAANQQMDTFYIPPVLAKGAEDDTFVLLSEKGSTTIQAFDPNKPLVETTGTVVLYRPGLLLTLIPEMDFAACYVINLKNLNLDLNVQNFAVIVVHKDFTDGVHVGRLPLQNPQWQMLNGTNYVSTYGGLQPDSLGKSVIWHASSTMAVYFVGNTTGALFGNPAAIISKTPDFWGCALRPEIIKIGEEALSWQASIKYCSDKNLKLVTFNNAQLQEHVYNEIIEAKNASLQEVWIGMRRSSLTGEWYWLDQTPVTYTNWAEGEPGGVSDGQCAIMSLNSEASGWRDKDCCVATHPVCYREPILLSN
ncbi:uncharacterized protein LOC123967636 [Micropterus dolomieu]|uniref:uncharacterized protein LOC123967636 n=1 Tax=Micropterus dolomieu TaxID=147949 RepID=UPI001E8CE5E0|nr:uncharacterized protein LOC123967636 [Micropterus dolomieu]XP_045899751.1 uncharacterized protein LOC123967636 [Micropterus dolomieu]